MLTLYIQRDILRIYNPLRSKTCNCSTTLNRGCMSTTQTMQGVFEQTVETRQA